MRISCNWLAEYVRPDWTPEELADRLTMSGLEVESVDAMGSDFDGVVVGRVLEVVPHPDADRLRVCNVDLGDGSPTQIVCGAPNVAEGQLVPVATVGTTLDLPDRNNPEERVPVTLKRAKIRGQESNGMICAEDELGLSEDHAGIMVLDAQARLGQPFAEYLTERGIPTSDVSIDVSITPNRPDAICHLGVARDVAALAGLTVQEPAVDLPSPGGEAASQIAVEIESPDGCHRYVGMIVRDVKVGESPAWLRSRLETIGLRPRNNVVDITNYVMFECGQPLHAFDYDQIAGRKIIVRRRATKAPFVTLDGKERELPAGTLMIADAERDVAIAGVMGGENSEVSDQTVNVLIESAYFEPSGIRRSAKALGLQTDASYRFERGIDPTGQVWAAARAAELMRDLAGGSIVEGAVDCHPVPFEPIKLTLRSSRIADVLGVEVPHADAERLLRAIGFGVSGNGAQWTVTVPAFRPDVTREIDLIEEVARLVGLDQIPEPAHGRVPNQRLAAPPALAWRQGLSDHIQAQGFREIYTNSMLSVERASAFADASLRGGNNVGPVVRTMNPISQEMAALRPSLLPGALQVTAHNLNHGQPGVRLFEFGMVFDRFEQKGQYIPGFREQEHLLVLSAGLDGDNHWNGKPQESDVFHVKGLVSGILGSLGLGRAQETPVPAGSALTRYHLNLTLRGKAIGTVGCLAPEVGDLFGLETPVFFAELDFSTLAAMAATRGVVTYQPVSRFPVVQRDLAVSVPAGEPVGPMTETISRAGGKLLSAQRVFDVYQGRGIADGQKSVGFNLSFSSDRTLTDKEVDKAFRRVVDALVEGHGATLRG